MARNKPQGPVQRFISSIVGVLIGVGLVIGSFVVLWLNEGRVDLSTIAAEALPVDGARLDPGQEGQLVAVTGRLRGDRPLGDSPYLREGNYLSLERVAEMYAWEEEEEDDDGTTTYSYRRVWTTSPEDSSRFNNPEGHTNPPMRVIGAEYRVDQSWVGEYVLDPSEIFLMNPEILPLTGDLTIDRREVQDNYIFLGAGTLDDPLIGDIRLSYKVFRADTFGTAFGRQAGDRLVTYRHDDGETLLYRAYTLDREASLADMHREYLTNLWLTRGGGFLMMWIGMLLFLGPLRALLDFIPLVGRAGRFLIGVITLFLAFFLSLVTITVSAIAHNPFALAAVILLIIGGVFFWRSRATAGKRLAA